MSDLGAESYQQAETQPWIRDITYQGHNIRVVEFDHQLTRGVDFEHVTYPQNWRDPLAIQIKNSGNCPIMPEYFVPELYKGVYSNAALGKLAQLKGEMEHVTPFFGYIAKVAGENSRDIVVADPGISTWYGVIDRINLYGHVIPGTLARKSFDQIYEDYYGGLHLATLRGEEKKASMVDARRLYTARALVQESSRSNSDILHLTAPRHAERVVNYISRQTDYETVQPVKSPEQMKSRCPKEEQLKMAGYRLVLKPEIRRFKPTLTSESYGLDILVNDTADEHYESPTEIRPEKMALIETSVKNVLQQKPLNNHQKTYQDKLRETCLPAIKRVVENPDTAKPNDYALIKESVTTHYDGWEKTGTDRIY